MMTHAGVRAHASILVVVLWAFAVIDLTTPGAYLRYSGVVKGADFIQFYTAAVAAKRGAYNALVSPSLFHDEQVRLVPESGEQFYPPVYGPQVALAVKPLAALGYFHAYATWIAITATLYVVSLRCLVRLSPVRLRWRLVALLAAAFPAFWSVVVHGQLSAVALIALAAAGRSLRHGARWSAGAALGVLAYKPSLFVPALAMLVFAGEWRIVVTATILGVAQLVLMCPVVGADVVLAYGRNLVGALSDPGLVATNPLHLHSLHSFWSALLPTDLARDTYLATATMLLWAGGIAWNHSSDPLERLATLSCVVALASPHCYSYDLLVLAPVFVWCGSALTKAGAAPPSVLVTAILYLSFAIPLWAPLSVLSGIHLSTLVIIALALCVFTVTLSSEATTRNGTAGAPGPTSSSWPLATSGTRPGSLFDRPERRAQRERRPRGAMRFASWWVSIVESKRNVKTAGTSTAK